MKSPCWMEDEEPEEVALSPFEDERERPSWMPGEEAPEREPLEEPPCAGAPASPSRLSATQERAAAMARQHLRYRYRRDPPSVQVVGGS